MRFDFASQVTELPNSRNFASKLPPSCNVAANPPKKSVLACASGLSRPRWFPSAPFVGDNALNAEIQSVCNAPRHSVIPVTNEEKGAFQPPVSMLAPFQSLEPRRPTLDYSLNLPLRRRNPKTVFFRPFCQFVLPQIRRPLSPPHR